MASFRIIDDSGNWAATCKDKVLADAVAQALADRDSADYYIVGASVNEKFVKSPEDVEPSEELKNRSKEIIEQHYMLDSLIHLNKPSMDAMKYYRNITGCNLKEAYDYIRHRKNLLQESFWEGFEKSA